MGTEVLVPSRGNIPVSGRSGSLVTTDPPGTYPSILDAARVQIMGTWHRRAAETAAVVYDARARAVEAHNGFLEAKIKNTDLQAKLYEAPERIGHEIAVRRAFRAEELRQAQHVYEVNEMRRLNEITKEETAMTLSRTDLASARYLLTDAEQKLKAQKEYGHLTYKIFHQKRVAELLDLELSNAERRELYEESVAEMRGNTLPRRSIDLDRDEYARSEQLHAAGLDTNEVEAILRKRKR